MATGDIFGLPIPDAGPVFAAALGAYLVWTAYLAYTPAADLSNA